MRVSRPCYDKQHRCPSWAGGGMRYARVNRCTCSGSLVGIYDRRHWQWRPYWNRQCDVLVLPYVVRFIDPGHWKFKARWWARELRDWWRADR